MKYLTIALLLIATPCFAQTYSKVDDTTIRSVETKETSTDMTIAQIKHELEGVRNDMTSITDSYNRQMATFQAIEDKYVKMLEEADKLGIEEPKTEITTPIGE